MRRTRLNETERIRDRMVRLMRDFEKRHKAFLECEAERDRYREALEEILRCTDIESAHANANNAIKR